MDFHGKVAIVTGGAQGIGKGITKQLLLSGAAVVVADSDKRAGKLVTQEYYSLGNITALPVDVAAEADVKETIAQTLDLFKRVDFIVNNAGVAIFKSLDKMSLQEWQHIIGINLTGTFLFAKYGARHLQKTQGAIVNIASTRALMSEPDTEAYSATKGGIVSLTHALAISLGPKVRVNCISPGWIETRDWQASKHKVKHSRADNEQHPAGRVGTPEDVASMTEYLLSDAASFITGQNFIVDGGMVRKMIYV
jgi:NAD(P)-dependent dehydrogenase (short-subunit alcohol dehydrogenase family)